MTHCEYVISLSFRRHDQRQLTISLDHAGGMKLGATSPSLIGPTSSHAAYFLLVPKPLHLLRQGHTYHSQNETPHCTVPAGLVSSEPTEPCRSPQPYGLPQLRILSQYHIPSLGRLLPPGHRPLPNHSLTISDLLRRHATLGKRAFTWEQALGEGTRFLGILDGHRDETAYTTLAQLQVSRLEVIRV